MFVRVVGCDIYCGGSGEWVVGFEVEFGDFKGGDGIFRDFRVEC